MVEIFGTVLDVRSLFGQERRELLQLLDSLSAAEWSAPTVFPGWTVHDLAGHILSDYMRRLSRAGTAWPGRSSPRRDPARLPGPGQRRVRPCDAAGQPRADRPVAHRPRPRARPAAGVLRSDRAGDAGRVVGRSRHQPGVVGHRARVHRVLGAPATDPGRGGAARRGRARAGAPGARRVHARATPHAARRGSP
ncbi:maleylpyruvate isomerase N-terminal domain-containing protein [Amycolatopsis methanolica]|uniref:maleylpyruvate isomerase N-terminal domain-containing protein n=1 Tax=Amycolatopsis methanolica TaxID=1814 RepID=UPI00343543B8